MKNREVIFTRPESLQPIEMHYCAGCGHGIAHRLIAEVVDELGIREKIIGIAPVGCAVLAYDYFNFDCTEAAHGRPPAVATGMKRARPDLIIFSYQGDGDLAAIGTAEIIHAANRGEKISVFFVNNTVYGMTGGQMAPTTLIGEKTLTSPSGRNKSNDGEPLHMLELLASFDGVVYASRTSVHDPKNVVLTKKSIKKAFQCQIDDRGFSIVEILSPCPTYKGLSPIGTMKWIQEVLIESFPLGILKDY
ncbi:thiamine pyrophosphate-dependent enzyme [Chlamydiota bacterium]